MILFLVRMDFICSYVSRRAIFPQQFYEGHIGKMVIIEGLD